MYVIVHDGVRNKLICVNKCNWKYRLQVTMRSLLIAVVECPQHNFRVVLNLMRVHILDVRYNNCIDIYINTKCGWVN